MKSLAILGRQPALGLAELESLLGSEALHPLTGGAVALDVEAREIPFARLGSVIKLGNILSILETTDWFAIEDYLIDACKTHSAYVPEGKLTIGISVYGLKVTPKMLERTSLSIKKAVKSTGRPVRIVPNKTSEISTPQIIHNKLTHENGWELVLFRDGNKTLLMRTAFVQDIEAYTARDQARPARDARVGMLPPKLAQTIINLADARSEVGVVLDAFCGTGVVLQEASLMGYDSYGTDIEPRMIEYSTTNLRWLRDKWNINNYVRIELGDATSHTWNFETLPVENKSFTLAGEGYLGLPFAHLPSDAQLHESIQSSNTIAKGFFRNLANQVPKGFRGCIALPAWHIKGRVTHLPCVSQLESLGFERIAFTHASNKDLIYHREDQVVGRELVVFVKK